GSVGTTSDAGTFSHTVSPGEHSLKIEKDGFLPDESKIQAVSGEQILHTAQLRADTEYQQWQRLASSNDLRALQNFLRENPGSRFVAQARDRAEQLEWGNLKSRNDASILMDLNDFLTRCRGPVCADARARMNLLRGEEEEWVRVRDSNRV